MRTSTLTPRQTFRETLAQVAEQARALLPEQVNGRIESAVTLVLAGDVVFAADGHAEIASSSDPLKVYHLVGTACDCADYPSVVSANLLHGFEHLILQNARRDSLVVLAVPVGTMGTACRAASAIRLAAAQA